MYNRDQPRIPKHHHGGGRWTRDSYGLLSDLGMPRPPKDDDENAQQTLADLPRYAWMRDPQERERPVYDSAWSGRPPVQDPAAGAGAAGGGWSLLDWLRGGISAAEARGWDEYERLSEQNSPGRRAVITFRVGEFRRGRADVLEFDGVKVLTGEQLKKLCDKVDKVQELINEAAKKTREEGKFNGPLSFGREVHLNLKELIKEKPVLDLESERSFVITGKKARYGEKGSVRPDLKEKEEKENKHNDDGDETLCFYDGKTGKARLDPRYMHKVANYVLKTRPKAKRVIVTEVKPEE
jgi:hypothetical protein